MIAHTDCRSACARAAPGGTEDNRRMNSAQELAPPVAPWAEIVPNTPAMTVDEIVPGFTFPVARLFP
jgi:hypothetical protein